MKFMVYTDGAGSYEKNRASCSYFIMSEEQYIGSDYKTLKDMYNPTQAETIGVGLAAKYLLDNITFKPEDRVEFYVDCTSTISFCRKNTKDQPTGRIASNNERVISAIKNLRTLCKKTNVFYFKVKGHKAVVNPNSYVDRLAKFGVRK